jgi:mRNA-degrading endonuclease YafQ of YafQ-DinJ toxin-antitoxin module
MRVIRRTAQFKKDAKRVEKQSKDLDKYCHIPNAHPFAILESR